MNINNLLLKLANKIQKNADSLFSVSVEKQERYLNSFPEPKDDIERSYFQYKCQMMLLNKTMRVATEIAAIPMIFFYIFKKQDVLEKRSESDTIFFIGDLPENIIPRELSEYKPYCVRQKKEFLTSDDLRFVLNIWKRYPFSPMLVLKVLLKIRFYSYEINSGELKRILTYSEYSYTSSALTAFCEDKGIEHINVMHGEKLFYIRDSFFRFSKCYVWSSYYAKLFTQLRAHNNYIVAIPPSLKFSVKSKPAVNFDFKYYLAGEDEATLLTIYKNLLILSEKYKVCVRPHPRYSDVNWLKEHFQGIKIEGFEKTIEVSILETRHVISLYSTVLTQAFHNGVNVVIDDVSDKRKFSLLKERKYVMLSSNHKLFSEFIW